MKRNDKTTTNMKTSMKRNRERERDILRMRRARHTLTNIGRKHGISRQRVTVILGRLKAEGRDIAPRT